MNESTPMNEPPTPANVSSDDMPSTLTPPPPPATASSAVVAPRRRWWAIAAVGTAWALLAVVIAASVLPSSLVAEKLNRRLGVEQPAPFARTPASAEPVNDRIAFGELDGQAEQFPPEGDFYFVTVTEPSQSVLSWFVGRDEPAVQFLTREDKFGFQTPQQRRTFALESMRTSEQVAQFVALDRIGFDAELLPGEVLIEAMVCLEASDDGTTCEQFSPSDDVLDPGDRILTVDGASIEGVEDLVEVLDGRSPGDVVPMRIDRPGEGELDVEVELTSSPDDPDRTIVGFFPFDTRRVELPFDLDIDTGRIGGPSAGLAFTLTLIDQLTEGELTGETSVAVTGTINLDGTVGPIGGLRQKASAVDQTGVEVFLVPEAQGPDDIAAARAAAPDLTIVPVADLDDALEALVELGGDPLDS